LFVLLLLLLLLLALPRERIPACPSYT